MWQWSPIRIWGTDMIEGKQDQGGKELTGIAGRLPEQQVYVGWWEITGPLLPPSSSSQLFVQTIWLGKEGVVPEGCEGELSDQGENSMLRVGKHTMLAAGCDFPCHHCYYMYVPQCRLSLICQMRGLEDCWPSAHWGTCWENFAHAATFSVAPGLPLTFLITLKFSHMALLLVWTVLDSSLY